MKAHIACFTALLLIQIPHLTTGTGNADKNVGSHSMSDDRKDDNANLIKESAKNYIGVAAGASRKMEETQIFGSWAWQPPTKKPTWGKPTKKPITSE